MQANNMKAMREALEAFIHGYMEANKHDNDFNAGFHNWMQSAMAADWYARHGKSVPRKWRKRLDEGRRWIENLSAEDYDRLIH